MAIIDDHLDDVAVVFTGALPSGITRKEATSMVLSHGGIVENSISQFTDYLVAADPKSNSAKIRKARDVADKRKKNNEPPLKIITERQLWEIAETGKKI